MTILKKKLRIVADENMPKVNELFSAFGDVALVDGRSLTNEQIKDADVLLVRSVTKVNRELLAASSVKFVGTATIGVDHIDTAYLKENNIGFASSPGCNANAVADYVVSSMCYLHSNKKVDFFTKKIGVIGFGNVGRRVFERLTNAGCSVAVYDPYKGNEEGVNFVSLGAVMQSDIICLHAPLTTSGKYPTYHMLNDKMLSHLSEGSSIISAGRGGVIDEKALLNRYEKLDSKLNLIFDVWENEPDISLATLSVVDIATPHIAGYSKQGREVGTLMVFEAFLRYFKLSVANHYKDCISKGSISSIVCPQENQNLDVISKVVNSIYDVMHDDSYMRSAYRKNPRDLKQFDALRKNYVERDELNTCYVSDKRVFTALGFSSCNI